MQISKNDLQRMTVDEKHELLDMLWESLEQEHYIDDAAEETGQEKQILQERLEEYIKNPSDAIEWQHLKDDLL